MAKLVKSNEIEVEFVNKDVDKLMDQACTIIETRVSNINHELITMYWELGEMVCNYKKENNSKYGDAIISDLSEKLSFKYGPRFNQANIYHAINFYELFPILTPGSKSYEIFYPGRKFKNVSWSHIRELLKFKDIKVILYYLNEVETKRLSKRDLEKLVKSISYERTIAHQQDGEVKHKIEEKLHDPLWLDIVDKKRSEKELEDEIYHNMSNFKKEIGNNIMFDDRQYKINHNGLRYRVDFVLYDKLNKFFVYK